MDQQTKRKMQSRKRKRGKIKDKSNESETGTERGKWDIIGQAEGRNHTQD